MSKLSEAQRRALAELAKQRGSWFTPRDAQARKGTLEALARRRLVWKRYGIGGIYSLRDTPLYQITADGLKVLQEIKEVAA